MTLAGQGFAPGETVDLRLANLYGELLTTTTAQTDESFSTVLPAHFGAYGLSALVAIGTTSKAIGISQFQVLPRLFVSPVRGLPGSIAQAQGFGFGAGDTVSLFWGVPGNSLDLGSATTPWGNFYGDSAISFSIPAAATPGPHQITACGQDPPFAAPCRVAYFTVQ